MYSKDCKHFTIRKKMSPEAVPMAGTMKDKFIKYFDEILQEKAYIEAEFMDSDRREMKFTVAFSKERPVPSVMEKILTTLICLVFSEAKAEGERLTAESYKNLVIERVRKYREGLCQ